MLNTVRAALLSALSMLSATAAWADTPMSPVPLLAVREGTLVHVDRDGSRVLAECTEVSELRMLSGPQRGQLQRESKPCSLGALAVHPPTGRWALDAGIRGDNNVSRTVSITVSGREVALPTDKAGRVKQGDLLILGDTNGVVAITSGTPEMWTTNGKYREQRPVEFTPDGSRVLVTAGDSGIHEFWSWSFAPRPDGIRVLPAGISDSAGTELVRGEPRIVLRHPRGGVRLATQDPTGKLPWKISAPLRQARRGLLTPLVLGDTMVFYREGAWLPEAGCDESSPGTYRRFELSTGQERVWRRHEGTCSTGEFLAASLLRRTVYFREGHPWLGYRLYEYELDRDATREIKLEGGVSELLDLSADGRLLLVLTYRGLVLHDVVTGDVTGLTGLVGVTHARLLASQ